MKDTKGMIRVDGINWAPVELDEQSRMSRTKSWEDVAVIKTKPHPETGKQMPKYVIIAYNVFEKSGLDVGDFVRLYGSDGVFMLRKEKSCYSYRLSKTGTGARSAVAIQSPPFARTLHRVAQAYEFEATAVKDGILLIPKSEESDS